MGFPRSKFQNRFAAIQKVHFLHIFNVLKHSNIAVLHFKFAKLMGQLPLLPLNLPEFVLLILQRYEIAPQGPGPI